MMQSSISGPRLNKIMAEVKTWAVDWKLRMREELTKDIPYNAVKLSPQEQISRFLEMSGQDYEQVVLQLNSKYLGHPRAYDMVNEELANFLYAQIGNALRMSGVSDEQ